jgi:tetratricopeptide (TPR) repeat protein
MDADICVCTDLDETFEKGWRRHLEEAWEPGVKQGKYLYNWSLNADGTPYVQFTYSKVHTRSDFIWKYPVHEWLSYRGTEPLKTVFIENMVLNHRPDGKKSRGSYLPLLQMAEQEEPQDARMAYYLGREYMYHREWQKCIDTLKRHLSLPSAVWREERCASMRWIAKACFELGNSSEAYRWYFRAIAEAPHMRDPYIECALMAYRLMDWPAVFWMTAEALKIRERSKVYVNMGYCWDHTPHDLHSIACYRLGMYDRALDHAKAALEKSPGDRRLFNNVRLIEQKISSLAAQ